MPDIMKQVQKRFQAGLKSRYITKIFPVTTADQHIHLICITSSGDRLRFVCSANSANGPFVEERSAKRTKVTNTKNAKELHYGFWLIGFSPYKEDDSLVTTRGMMQSERAPRDEYGRALDSMGRPVANTQGTATNPAPVDSAKFYSDGVQLAGTNQGGLTHGVEVRVRCSGLGGRSEPHEYFVNLPSQAKALIFAEERLNVDDGSTTQGMLPLPRGAITEGLTPEYLPDRTFVLFLADAVQVLSLHFAICPTKRAPIADEECCGCLAMAAASSSRKPSWMWTFDDVRYPPIELQQQYVTSEKSLAPPNMARGKWFGGLFNFLSALVGPIWESPVFAVNQANLLQVSLTPQTLEAYIHALRQLRDFLRRPLQQAEMAYNQTRKMNDEPDGIHSTRSRREILAERSVEEHGLNLAQRELHAIGTVLDRIQQVFALLRAYISEVKELQDVPCVNKLIFENKKLSMKVEKTDDFFEKVSRNLIVFQL